MNNVQGNMSSGGQISLQNLQRPERHTRGDHGALFSMDTQSMFKLVFKISIGQIYLIQLRNPTDVSNVGKPSYPPVTFGNMKEVTLERNPMDVNNVGKPSLLLVNFKYMKEIRLVRNTRNVSNVGKTSHTATTCENVKGLTLKINPTDASNVGKLFNFQLRNMNDLAL